MNFAVSLIMAGLLFRLCNIPLQKIDLFPDVVGMLLVLLAVTLLRKKEDDFRSAFLPCVFAVIFSAWNWYNFMPSAASVGFAVIYAGLEGGLLLAECLTYSRLFDGFGAYYRGIGTGGKRWTCLYALSHSAGIALTLAVWFGGGALFTVGYCVWLVLHAVISTRLAYEFYLLKPKFHKKR